MPRWNEKDRNDAKYLQDLFIKFVKGEKERGADATNLSVPSYPVVQLAYGMALRERGETGGQTAAEQFGLANIALADAIQIDANKYPSEMTFWAV